MGITCANRPLDGRYEGGVGRLSDPGGGLRRCLRRRRGEHGFTLLELMIVVALIAIIAAIAIPSLMNARKASNEASALSALRTLTTAQEQYRTRFNSYADTLASLAGAEYIDSVLGAGSKASYTFTEPGGTPSTWSVVADPLVPGETGDRSFFVDESGVIRWAEPGPATATSPPID